MPPVSLCMFHISFLLLNNSCCCLFCLSWEWKWKGTDLPHSLPPLHHHFISPPLLLLLCYCLSLWSIKIKKNLRYMYVSHFLAEQHHTTKATWLERVCVRERVQLVSVWCRSWVCLATGEKTEMRPLMIVVRFEVFSLLLPPLSSSSACHLLPPSSSTAVFWWGVDLFDPATNK